jgi:hypothetical protein
MSHPPGSPYQPGDAPPPVPSGNEPAYTIPTGAAAVPPPAPYPAQPASGAPYAAPPAPTAQYPQAAGGAYAAPPPSGAPYVPPGQPTGYEAGPVPGFAAAPGYDPASAPPASGPPPMSAPPLSGAPYSAAPYGAPYGAPAGPAGPKRNPTVLVLAIVAGLLFILGGVMTALYIGKSGDLDRTEKNLNAQVASRDEQLTAKSTELDTLKRDLEAANAKLATAEQDLAGTKNAKDQTEKEKAAIAKCLNLVNTFLSELADGDRAGAEKAADALTAPCREADRYL